MDVSGWLGKQLGQASPDLLRAMVQESAGALMSAEANALRCVIRRPLAEAGSRHNCYGERP
jgi:hypothetical protein